MKASKKSEQIARKLRYRVESGKIVIDLQLKNLKQLFDFRDPAPFRERDLDEKAIEYIVSATEEIGYHEPLKIVIHYTEDNGEVRTESVVGAIHSYFEYEANILRRKVKQVFQQGRIFLFMGIVFLALLLSAAEFIANSNFPLKTLFREGLIITGWVAMWKPIETFLYGWWPLRRKEKCYQVLAGIEVNLIKLESNH